MANRANRSWGRSRRSLSQRRARPLQTESLEARQMLSVNPLHNEALPTDTNVDGFVTALDALVVINALSQPDDAARSEQGFTDVNNDGHNTSLDALMVINALARAPGTFSSGVSQNESSLNRVEEDDVVVNLESTNAIRDDDSTTAERRDVVLDWNNLFNEVLVDSVANQNPGYASRAMAILNVAIYDAVAIASGAPDDTFYDYDIEPRSGERIVAEVAASQAAYTVLSSLYADQQGTIDAFLDQMRPHDRETLSTDASVSLGTQIGNDILAERADDGSDAIVDYSYSDGIGSFQADPLNPDVPVWGPGWGEVEPFAIAAADSYAPDGTPDLTSVEYADSYNEAKELGAVDSSVRTADQTESGIFWAYDREGLGTPLSLFNDVLETIAVQEGNTFRENAALFAQASVSMADAAIVAWQTKFSEEFWRPVTAIHDGDIDGNPLTEGDPDWVALGAPDGGEDIIGFTPQFPTYISGHATFGGALFGSLQEFYGTDDIAFDLTSQELEILLDNPDLQEEYGLDLDDAVRSFDSLSEAMAENGRSRVYLGIHFDFDDLDGQEVGQAVAATVASEFVVASNGGGEGPGGNGPGGNGPGGGGPGGGGPVANDLSPAIDRSALAVELDDNVSPQFGLRADPNEIVDLNDDQPNSEFSAPTTGLRNSLVFTERFGTGEDESTEDSSSTVDLNILDMIYADV